MNVLELGSKVLLKADLANAKTAITTARMQLLSDDYDDYNESLKRAISYLQSAVLVLETPEP